MILQIGAISEHDKTAQMVAISPDPNVQMGPDFLKALHFEKVAHQRFIYKNDTNTISIGEGLNKLIDYVEDQNRDERLKATLVCLHSEHLIQLVHAFVAENKKMRFLKAFGNYSIVEEELRREKRLEK